MNILDAVIQGLVQGFTEFLPVSSSGHLSLVQHFTGNGGEAGGMFTVLLHFGTLVAVFIAFFPIIWQLVLEFCCIIRDIFTGKFSFKTDSPSRRMIFMLFIALLPMIPAYLLKDFYNSFSTDNDIIVEGVCFIITAVMLFLSDACFKGKKGPLEMRSRDALAVGIAQAIAPLPGVSRSGSTIATGLLMGLNREYAVSFSFILGVPAVLAANVLEFKDLIGGEMQFSTTVLIVGVVIAAVSGLLAIKMVQWIVKTDKFKWFGFYTLILGILVIGAGIYEKVSGQVLAFF